ncbi:MAG: hypothetical protein DRO06_01365 [Thermoproteota archaeon]|nr:MAG: hypothetical protein DRO06_01365 [Candidatus Korarchaeota archaeon]
MVFITPISHLRAGSTFAAIAGAVVESLENYLVVDDGTGRARVYSDDAPAFSPGALVIAVGVVIQASGDVKELQADALVDISGADPQLLKETLKAVAEVLELRGSGSGGEV